MDSTEENVYLDEVLQTHCTHTFRKGYIQVDGVTMLKKYQEMHEEIANWKVSEEDVWLCSFPKTGTTWTQEMVWMIMNDLDFETETTLPERFPFLESSMNFDYTDIVTKYPDFNLPPNLENSLKYVKTFESPICIKTHLPWNLLPIEIQSGKKKPKMIYICRNPKDTCTSYYHHARLLEGYSGGFDDFCRLFLSGKVVWSPFWPHILQFFYRQHEKNILFLTYEELTRNLRGVIRKTANFLNKPLTEENVERLEEHLSFQNMKNNKAVNTPMIAKIIGAYQLCSQSEGNFIRKGIVGSYKEEMSEEMRKRFDEWSERCTEGSGFDFLDQY